jgi:hypothetical protein
MHEAFSCSQIMLSILYLHCDFFKFLADRDGFLSFDEYQSDKIKINTISGRILGFIDYFKYARKR